MINFILRTGAAVLIAFGSYTVGYNQGFFDGIKDFAKRIADDADTFERIVERQVFEREKE